VKRLLTFLFVLMFAGSPVAAAACAVECAPPEAALTTSGCHEHPARGQAGTRVVALHICADDTGAVQYLQSAAAVRIGAPPAAVVPAPWAPPDVAHAVLGVPDIAAAVAPALALSLVLRV
jgi:hypothetical protein